MLMVYVYVLDTLADWELGQVLAELSSRPGFLKRRAAPLSQNRRLLQGARPHDGRADHPARPLPGRHRGGGGGHAAFAGGGNLERPQAQRRPRKGGQFLSAGAAVAAICGATAALADFGLLDRRPHTSNGPGFLDTVCARYAGQKYYVDAPAAADGGLITAGSAGALPWAKEIIRYLDVFEPDTLEAWYAYFSTGAPEHFFALLQSLPGADRG